jgi:hypothetical protein
MSWLDQFPKFRDELREFAVRAHYLEPQHDFVA